MAGQDPIELVASHASALIGTLEEKWVSHLEAQWRHGFIVGLTVTLRSGEDLGALVREVLSVPLLTSTLETFAVGVPGGRARSAWSEALRALVAHPLAASLKSLRFEPQRGEGETQVTSLEVGDFAIDWSRFESLETLVVYGGHVQWGRL